MLQIFSHIVADRAHDTRITGTISRIFHIACSGGIILGIDEVKWVRESASISIAVVIGLDH